MTDNLILGESSNEDIELDQDLPANVANLSMSLVSLSEIDGTLLSKKRQGKLAKMKRQIFDALAYYCDCLPEEEDIELNQDPQV